MRVYVHALAITQTFSLRSTIGHNIVTEYQKT